MSTNSRFKFGPATTKPAGGVPGLLSIKPEMMYEVFSSIKRADADEAPNRVKLMEFFSENSRGIVKCKIPTDRSSLMAGPALRIQDSRLVSGGAQDKQCAAQMTIFYNGAVNVYNVSAEKAEAINNLAMSSCTKTMVSMISSEQISKHHSSRDEQVRKLCGGLPIARKLSLQRFLQKRNDRTRSTAPYSSTGTAGSDKGNYKEEDVEQHMGLSLGRSHSGFPDSPNISTALDGADVVL